MDPTNYARRLVTEWPKKVIESSKNNTKPGSWPDTNFPCQAWDGYGGYVYEDRLGLDMPQPAQPSPQTPLVIERHGILNKLKKIQKKKEEKRTRSKIAVKIIVEAAKKMIEATASVEKAKICNWHPDGYEMQVPSWPIYPLPKLSQGCIKA